MVLIGKGTGTGVDNGSRPERFFDVEFGDGFPSASAGTKDVDIDEDAPLRDDFTVAAVTVDDLDRVLAG